MPICWIMRERPLSHISPANLRRRERDALGLIVSAARVRRIYSGYDRYVWLTCSGAKWSALPTTVKNTLLGGLDRIAKIRADLSGTAKVKTMPPVEVVCELWVMDTGTIPACGAWPLQVADHVRLGV